MTQKRNRQQKSQFLKRTLDDLESALATWDAEAGVEGVAEVSGKAADKLAAEKLDKANEELKTRTRELLQKLRDQLEDLSEI